MLNVETCFQNLTSSFPPEFIRSELEAIRASTIARASFPEWCLNLSIDGHPFSFDRREYLRTPYGDDHPYQVDLKATQVGGTVRAMLRAAYGCLYKGWRNVLYYFPSRNDVTEFSKGRIKPLIEENPGFIGSHIRETDSANIKQIGSAFWYLLGMRSAMQVKSVPGNMAIFDEFDEAPQLSFDKALERLGGQMEAKDVVVHLLSNPTLPDFGVSREFEATDQHHWLLRCPHCGHHNNLTDAFMAWVQSDESTPSPLLELKDGTIIRACGKCRKELDPDQGEWVPKYPDRDKRGYHYTQLWSQTYMHRPDNILAKYRKAQQSGNLVDFFNLTIGIGYVEAHNRLAVEQVLALSGAQGMASGDNGPCYMGVDQGKDHYVVIGKHMEGDLGEVVHLGKYRDWDDIADLMGRFRVIRCVVDALPETRNARQLADAFRGRVFLCYYNKHQKGAYAWNEKDFTVQVNRTESMDASHNAIQDQKIVLPRNGDTLREFAQHCHNVAKKLEEEEETDPKTRQKRKTGTKRWVYVNLGPDHFRHAFNYHEIARSEARRGLFS